MSGQGASWSSLSLHTCFFSHYPVLACLSVNAQVEKNEMYFLVVNFEAVVEGLEEEKPEVVDIGDCYGLPLVLYPSLTMNQLCFISHFQMLCLTFNFSTS